MEESTTPMPSHQNRTLGNQSEVLSTATRPTPGIQGETKTPSDKVHDPIEQKPTTPAEDFTLVSTIAPSVTTQAASHDGGSYASWGYVLMVLLLLVIIILLIILYLLRRASRTYSFDLRHGAAGNHGKAPAGNFEVLYSDDQGRQTPCDNFMSPVANGTDAQSEEHELQEEMHVNHSQASHSGDSDVAIPDHSPKKSEPWDAAEEEPNQHDITPPVSSGLLDEKDFNEPLQFNLHIASSSSTSSSNFD
ncbi:uncharacterized protein LOC109520360 [Hippocampus comes]|uniref:uncharacterized protein LOC109520360 n=1 Tax=Hippocampus comes TaxID=109280 RepID=UPI00094F1C3C|nr:PREDICTED: uncharacterized protein LOC109520360 [Hippocampus comes]XP_019733075.1 PREDICTED: uncharacterized protein LOC109520360 [Hippocampus comes]